MKGIMLAETCSRNIMNFKVKENKINADKPQMYSSEMLKSYFSLLENHTFMHRFFFFTVSCTFVKQQQQIFCALNIHQGSENCKDIIIQILGTIYKSQLHNNAS